MLPVVGVLPVEPVERVVRDGLPWALPALPVWPGPGAAGFPVVGALGGFGVPTPLRRCDRSVNARCVAPAPFSARYDPAPNAAPINNPAHALPTSAPTLCAKALRNSPDKPRASRSATFAARFFKTSRWRCLKEKKKVSRESRDGRFIQWANNRWTLVHFL